MADYITFVFVFFFALRGCCGGVLRAEEAEGKESAAADVAGRNVSIACAARGGEWYSDGAAAKPFLVPLSLRCLGFGGWN